MVSRRKIILYLFQEKEEKEKEETIKTFLSILFWAQGNPAVYGKVPRVSLDSCELPEEFTVPD